MRILIAEDDLISRRVLEGTLKNWGYEPVVVEDGVAAWEALQAPDAPKLAILDWMMPGLDGPEVCRRVREQPASEPPYLLLLTAKDRKEDVVVGLESGANDYLIKPFDRHELRARVRIGAQMVALQQQLAQRVVELEAALASVKQLQGLLPICCYCKRIRDEQDYWQQLESYLLAHTEATFSHGICPNCWQNIVKPEAARAGIAIP